ncbi:hypothetical protein R1flu_019849 [Riccia fluitans]|uniref:Uncharacterized protein n=1 Tax=Riccia fluitans TaxID=41844 RepID=A0ABD1ZJT3_9MARC
MEDYQDSELPKKCQLTRSKDLAVRLEQGVVGQPKQCMNEVPWTLGDSSMHCMDDVVQKHLRGFSKEAVSEAQDDVQDFELVIDEEEDVDKVEEEDILDPFWADPISRAGTFETSAS